MGGRDAGSDQDADRGWDVDGGCMTVTGKTLAENVKDLPGLKEGQQIVQPLSNPIKASSHIQILHGTLAPEGAVAKITGKEGLGFRGRRGSYDSEEQMLPRSRAARSEGRGAW